MKITRTYPQPDSNLPHIGPRERAMAVFKYLLGLEPEAAVLHPLFPCIVHSYEQAERQATLTWAKDTTFFESDADGESYNMTPLEAVFPEDRPKPPDEPLVPMLSSEQTVELRAHPYYDGKL